MQYYSLNFKQKKRLSGGNESFQSAYGVLVSEIGTKAYQADVNKESAMIIREQTEAKLENVRGVNLEEEGAKLLQYQQAYQAIAKLIGIANSLFDSIISGIR